MTLYALNFNDNNRRRAQRGGTGTGAPLATTPASLVYILAERIMDQVEAAGKQQATPQIATDQRPRALKENQTEIISLRTTKNVVYSPVNYIK